MTSTPRQLSLSSIVVAHTTSMFGPPHALVTYLKQQQVAVAYIEHPLTYSADRRSRLEVWQGNQLLTEQTLPNWGSNQIINYLKDFFLTLIFVARASQLASFDRFIGVDSLSTLAGLWLRPFFKWRQVIAYNVDYAEHRFSSQLVNRLYRWADRYTTRASDKIWCITKRIIKVRRQLGRQAADIILVPNGVTIASVNQAGRHDQGLIYVGNLESEKGIESIVDSLAQFPELKLTIYGEGSIEAELKQQVKVAKLTDQITFAGRVDHPTVLQNLAQYTIGIALYNQDQGYTHYCDPLKVKEYLAAGLPVIMTDVPELAELVKEHQVGVVISQLTQLPAALKTALDEAPAMAKRALALRDQFDWQQIFTTAFDLTDHPRKES